MYSQDEQIDGLTSLTPTVDDVVVSMDQGDLGIAKKTTFQAIRDLFKTYFDTIYQAVLISGTNIKTINSNSLLGSGNISLPVLSDTNYTDATVSGSGTVITINNDVVTNAKMANVPTATFKGRTTAGTGDPEDLTATQATVLLNEATTSLKGLLSAADKTKLDGLANEWTLDKTSSFTAGGTYDSGTLTTYDEYRVEIVGASTGGSPAINARFNSNTSTVYHLITMNQSGTFSASNGNTSIPLYTSNVGSGYRFIAKIFIDRAAAYGQVDTTQYSNGSTTFTITDRIATDIAGITSFQLSTISNISGTIKIYGRNY